MAFCWNMLVTSSEYPVPGADFAKCPICKIVICARRAETHRNACMIRNPDLVPPFSCRAAAGHMFHTANELHSHELVCPVVEELDYQHYGPTRFERPTEGGFTRAPTPTNLEPEEVWSEEEPVVSNAPVYDDSDYERFHAACQVPSSPGRISS